MKNFVKKGDSLTWTSDDDYESGDFVEIGDRAGVIVEDAASGDSVEVLVEGVVRYAKAAVACDVGDKLYYDAGADKLTTTSSSNKAAGWAATAQASGDSEVECKLGAF